MEDQTAKQIESLNQKMDTLLEYVNQQRLRSQAIEDLVADASLIGKDVYDSTVKALDEHEVVLEPDQLRELAIRLARNLEHFNTLMDTLGSAMDLMKDVGPIVNEVIIDGTKQLNSFEQKGYFEFFKESGQIIDNVVTHFSAADVRLLADNIVTILDTVKNLTQPDVLKSVDNAVKVFSSMEMEDVPSYSVFRVMREMNTPEMKKALGFFVSFMKNLSKQQ